MRHEPASQGPDQLADWPQRYGPVPPLADCHNPRPETGLGLIGKLDPGDTLILAPEQALAGLPDPPQLAQPGGSGKTQLAAALTHRLWDSRSVDLLIWLSAPTREAVLTRYAEVLAEFGEAGPVDDLAATAGRFLSWLADSARRWLVVIDDLADPADLDGLWPQGPQGRVVVTTRRHDTPEMPDRRILPVAAYTMREALAYLTARLHADPGQRTEALDLAGDLDYQPLALAHASAVLACTGSSCRDYRNWFADRKLRRDMATGTTSATAEVTWSLALDVADQLSPAGLARPALILASLLDPAGIPGAVFTTPAARSFLTGHPGLPAEPAQAREAVHNLIRAGLVTLNPGSTTRTVQVHPMVQALTRAVLGEAELRQAVRSAADALMQSWPVQQVPQRLAQALRDSAGRLREVSGDALWVPEAHPVLLRAGQSLGHGPLTGVAILYWEGLLDSANRALGPASPHTFHCLDGLASAYEAADRMDEAVIVHEQTLAQRQEQLGHDHPDTLTSCGYLAHAYATAGRASDALPLFERVIADREWVLGPRHPDTLSARADLAAAYLLAGDPGSALPIFEQTVADLERRLGPQHPDTLSARAGRAHAQRATGDLTQAVPEYERILAEREQTQGPDHPDTLSARADLAFAYRISGQAKQALPQYERTLADRERVLGRYDPDTLTARGNLANALLAAGRVKDAIPHYEHTLTDRELAQGTRDPDTLTARANLANAYHSAGRLKDALPLYEQTLTDCEQVLGPTHQATLTARANLAGGYQAALRLTDAVGVFERTLTDCELALGRDHPLTRAVRDNLEAVTRS